MWSEKDPYRLRKVGRPAIGVFLILAGVIWIGWQGLADLFSAAPQYADWKFHAAFAIIAIGLLLLRVGVRSILEGISAFLFIVGTVCFFLGGALTLIVGIPWSVVTMLNRTFPIPFWPFPFAFSMGILAYFLMAIIGEADYLLSDPIHPY